MAKVFKVEKMNCGGCARKATEAIRAVAPDVDIKVDLERKIVEIASDEIDEAVLGAAITNAGYPATPIH